MWRSWTSQRSEPFACSDLWERSTVFQVGSFWSRFETSEYSRSSPERHEDLGDAAVGHPAHARQRAPPLLLCLLHIWHRWSSTLGRLLTHPEGFIPHLIHQKSVNYTFNCLLYITFAGSPHQNKFKYFLCRPSSTTMLHKWDIPTTSHWTWRLPGVSLNCLFFDFELGIHWKANHCDIPPQCSIPNLYYKMDDDNTLPDYICATPNSFGESFWSKYFQSNPISFNQIQIFSTKSKYFQPNQNIFNLIQIFSN